MKWLNAICWTIFIDIIIYFNWIILEIVFDGGIHASTSDTLIFLLMQPFIFDSIKKG